MRSLKRAVTTAAAIAAMTTSLVAMPVSAAPEWNTNGGQETVDGETYLLTPVIEVELPGDLAFGVNPMKLNVSEEGQPANTDQIISGTYLIQNFSEVPVAVSAATSVIAGANVELLSDLAASSWDTANKQLKASTTAGKKAALLVQLYPKTIDDEGVMTPAAKVVVGNAKSNLKGDILTAAAPAKPVYFVLNAYNDTKASESMGGFQFDGAVDPNASFQDDEIKVKTVFEMKVLTEDQKTNDYGFYKVNDGGVATSTPGFFGTVKAKK